MGDYDIDLPVNYSVVRTSAHQVTIAPKTSDTSWGSNIIPTKVTELAWDDTYILAKQVGLKEDPNSNNGYQIPNSEDVHFWIVEIKSGNVFGPLDEEGFRDKRNELGISNRLALKKT
ncbi:DUF3997 domain-containing protein [Alkalihalobacterium chitinilyticum]|uniref:DUF3997 domain-containing protein n=1 Tax=Alkalihalobacterium chitinilyticum TaxID=2980103 RepID=A0ABT5VL24_9BACI|nr:DUF3997 domain-containing protein [Alkalihalobacterium chitinilyticum]MDE5416150.1 DUF3997 domain-containing protein [Alkalihalobacterium chitinilyticum]